MAKFNRQTARAVGRGPLQTASTTSDAKTALGGEGFTRDPKTELFLLAVSNMVGENTHHETANARDNRYNELCRAVAVADPQWMADFLKWLRAEGNMRTAPMVGALEAARAMVAAKVRGSRAMVASVLQRADEPGEALAYWMTHYGRSIPKPVKRGIADAAARLYNEYSLLKYDTASHGVRFGDVLDLVHPQASAPWQGHLFRHALDRRHGRANEVPLELPMVTANALLRVVAAADPEVLLDAAKLREGGFTWEDVLSLAGSKVDKAKLWEALIPTMGLMALIRNLRNFDEAGVSDEAAALVIRKLSDPAEIAKSKQFPFRFLSAYRNAKSLRWSYPLELAINASLANVPALPGRTLILVDQSPSMFPGYHFSTPNKSDVSLADQAKIFGSALALRAEKADLVQYGGTSEIVTFDKAESLMKMLDRFHSIDSTNTAAAVSRWYAKHDRVVIVTDEQSYSYDPANAIPHHVPLYVWNVAGYRAGNTGTGPNRHLLGGMTDAAFRLIPLIEGGRAGRWPWVAEA